VPPDLRSWWGSGRDPGCDGVCAASDRLRILFRMGAFTGGWRSASAASGCVSARVFEWPLLAPRTDHCGHPRGSSSGRTPRARPAAVTDSNPDRHGLRRQPSPSDFASPRPQTDRAASPPPPLSRTVILGESSLHSERALMPMSVRRMRGVGRGPRIGLRCGTREPDGSGGASLVRLAWWQVAFPLMVPPTAGTLPPST
jgi:hypothetical protein